MPLRAAVLALLLLFPATAAAQDPVPSPSPAPQEQRIRPGVWAGGIDLSNLTIAEAEARLRSLEAPLAEPVVVAVAGKRFRITPKQVRFAFDPLRTAKRAYYAGENDPPDQSQAGGTAARLDVPLAAEFRRGTIKGIVRVIDQRVHVPARNATVRITLRKMVKRRAKSGRDLDGRALRAAVEAALVNPDAAARLLKPGRTTVRAKVNANHLARIYRTVITIDKANFKLRLFKNLKLSKTYGVAVGLPAYPTPSGRFRITNKAVNPVWTAPNSPWAGELAGTQTPGGSPNNPLKARWMGIVNGVGIHGTGQEWSIGSRASHGCLRMRVKDVIDLYPRVPVGTPVLIK